MIRPAFAAPLAVLLAAGWLAAGCRPQPVPVVRPTIPAAASPEQPVRILPLEGAVASRDAELSGLVWHGDTLLLLPQYPDFGGYDGPGQGRLFALGRAQIEAMLESERIAPLEAVPVPLFGPRLDTLLAGFEGFEAIALNGRQVLLTVEAETEAGARAYVVTARLETDPLQLVLDEAEPVAIASRSGITNLSEEALIAFDEAAFAVHEANGPAVNADPVAHRVGWDGQVRGTVPFPPLDYRITDATAPDSAGCVWVVNYFFPGEDTLRAEVEPLAARYGQGPSHTASETVERLVELCYGPDGFTRPDRAPIQLGLLPEGSRNWEGIVRIGTRGFLLVTDTYPGTLLGFVPLPASPPRR